MQGLVEPQGVTALLVPRILLPVVAVVLTAAEADGVAGPEGATLMEEPVREAESVLSGALAALVELHHSPQPMLALNFLEIT